MAALFDRPEEKIRDYVFAEHNWHDYQSHERSVRSEKFLLIKNSFPDLPATPPADAVRSPTYRRMQVLHKGKKLNSDQMDCFITPRSVIELYDVQKDPFSLKNLAQDLMHQEVRSELLRAQAAWIARTNDKIPIDPTPDRFSREKGTRL
jgi:hypothetical protein